MGIHDNSYLKGKDFLNTNIHELTTNFSLI